MIADTRPARWLENAPDSLDWYNRFVLALSIAGGLLFLRSTGAGGLRMISDAINYMAAARSLVSGEGLLRFHTNAPFVHWGPLYPVFLAGVDLLSRILPFDFVETIRFTNVILYAVVIFLSGQLFRRYLRLHAIALIALVWVVCSFTLFNRTMFPLSESLFYVLTLVVVLYWPRILTPDATSRHYIIFGVLVSLTPVLRFAGYSVIPIVMLSIILFKHTIPLRKRFRLAMLFALTSLPLLLWLLYGQTTSAYRRLRGDPMAMIVDSLQRTPRIILNWFVSYEFNIDLIGIIVVVIILATIVWLHYHYHSLWRATGIRPDLRNHPLLVAQYVLVFMIGLFAAFISVRSPLNPRHMSVLYIFVMVLVFYLIEQLVCRIRASWLLTLVLIIVGLGTVYQATRTYRLASEGCCAGDSHRRVDLVQWLQQNQLGSGRYYSNTPLPLMYTSLPAYAAPPKLEDWPPLLETSGDVYLIWFDAADPAKLYDPSLENYYYPLEFDPQQLAGFAEMTVIVDLDHGQVYRLRPLPPG